MADAKIQQIRRSISSWSLSTVKKPKFNLSKIKYPKLKVLSRKKNRVEAGVEDTSATGESSSHLQQCDYEPVGDQASNSDQCQDEQIQSEEDQGPEGEEGGQIIHEPEKHGDQPTIVLTVHGHTSIPEPPQPPPSPGLLDPNDTIEYIDSDECEVQCTCGDELEYSDQWYDARGTLTRSRENLSLLSDEYEDVHATSTYYDAADQSTVQEKCKSPDKNKKGSQKAREWVQTFTGDTESRVKKWMDLQKSKTLTPDAKSKSEIRLDELQDNAGMWSHRNEIQLNATQPNVDFKEEKSAKEIDKERKEKARKESLKKIFQVRGKLSINPIIDSQKNTYTNTDIYMATTPYALVDPINKQDPKVVSPDLDISDDGIHCTSLDLDPGMDTQDNDDTGNIPDVIMASPHSQESHSHTYPTTEEKQPHIEVSETRQNNSKPHNEEINKTHNDFLNETVDSMFEENIQTPNTPEQTQNSENDSMLHIEKSERKKRKNIVGTLPKSIKTLAGSLFQQNDKTNENNDDIKEKPGRSSPFKKDFFTRRSSTPINNNSGKTTKEHEVSFDSINHQSAVEPDLDSSAILNADGPSDSNALSKEKDDRLVESSKHDLQQPTLPQPMPDVLPDHESVIPTIQSNTHNTETYEKTSSHPRDSTQINNDTPTDELLKKVSLLSPDNDEASRYYSFLTADDSYEPITDFPLLSSNSKTETCTPMTTAPTSMLQTHQSATTTPMVNIEDTNKVLNSADPQPNDSQPPIPAPRTKRGRYGYSVGPNKSVSDSIKSSPQHTSNSQLNSNDIKQTSSSSYKQSANIEPSKLQDMPIGATFPRCKPSKKQVKVPETVPNPQSKYEDTPRDSYDINDEPIYWEISETKGAPPRPSPRCKKSSRIPSEPSLVQDAFHQSQSPATSSTNLPDWIQKRGPIPSPRKKKQQSLQMLPTSVGDDDIETVKKKLQSMSSVPWPAPRKSSSRQHIHEDQFYSGKAASISYGFTSGLGDAPMPPMRPKKSSQLSLTSNEETESKIQNRMSLQGDGPQRWDSGELSAKQASIRRKRKKTDQTQGYIIPGIRPCVQRVGTEVMRLQELLAAVGLGIALPSYDKSDDLVQDVLYSVQSLMGGTGGGQWAVSSPSAAAVVAAGGQAGGAAGHRTSVTIDQVLQVLQEAFHVSQADVEAMVQQAKTRQIPAVTLNLHVREAKDLRPKTVKGRANPYATVVIPSSGGSQRTRLERDTLHPVWNQHFSLKINSVQKDVLRLEIWHEHDAVGMQQLTSVKDMKSLSRLVRGTTAHAQHHTNHLLGHVVMPLKDVSEGSTAGWYSLDKEGGETHKDRGSIWLQAELATTATLNHTGRQPYDALLARFIHHHLTLSANNTQDDWMVPWNGRISSAAAACLAQHAIMLGLKEPSLQLSWWCVGSRVASVDAAWTLSQLHRVQAALAKGAYVDHDLAELKSSLCYYMRANIERLKDLHSAFPPSSGVVAQHQLTFTLKALMSIENQSESRALMNEERLPNVQEAVLSSLTLHVKNWWALLVDEQLREATTTDQQIQKVINILEESFVFLTHAASFYNGIIKKEADVAYLQTAFLMVSRKINPCVRPLVMNIYNRTSSITTQDPTPDSQQYALEVGTSLWQLYRDLGRIHGLCESLPADIRAESGLRDYHRWFSRGVMRWLVIAIRKAQDMINKAVDLDTFEPVDNLCNFSSSATDTIGIFHDVKIWWLKLAWPDPDNSAALLAKILEDICCCATSYSDLLRDKVDTMFLQQQNTDQVFITHQICVGLNNIERVRRELSGLPSHFGFESLLEDIRSSGSGTSAAEQLESTVERLIFSSTENMEAKVNEFIQAVMERMKPTLEKAVHEACEMQNEEPLLDRVLYPNFKMLHNNLHSSNFQRFLWHVWELMVDLFHHTVVRNTEKRKANYFGGVRDLLEATMKFFSPDEGIGLDIEAIQTPAYKDLLELLDGLRMSTEALIAKYYQERCEEQQDAKQRAQLVVKALFTRNGKLVVEIIMAKGMERDSDVPTKSSIAHVADAYIKIQLVPQEWFPSVTIRKTKTQKKDPAVYEETFEFDIDHSGDGIESGLILFTLKDYNLGRSNTFIGESLVPLSKLPCVDSSQIHTIPNIYLNMTSAGLNKGYKSLRALQSRAWDKNAASFIKKVSKRLTETKTKSSLSLRPEEDKTRPRSPNLMDRLRFHNI